MVKPVKTDRYLFRNILYMCIVLAIVLAGIQYWFTTTGGQVGRGLIIVAVLFIFLYPLPILALYRNIVQIHTGELKAGFVFKSPTGIVFSITTLVVVFFMIVMILPIGIMLIIAEGQVYMGIAMIVVSGILILPLVKLAKSSVHKMVDPSNLPVDWSEAKARQIFKIANFLLLLGAICVWMATAGVYFIVWERWFLMGGGCLVTAVIWMRLFRYEIRRNVEKYDIPKEVNAPLWVRLF